MRFLLEGCFDLEINRNILSHYEEFEHEKMGVGNWVAEPLALNSEQLQTQSPTPKLGIGGLGFGIWGLLGLRC